LELAVRRFDDPDEERALELGAFQLVSLGAMTLGRASYEPGWKWSEHVGRALGQASCAIEHVGLVISGRNRITMDDGRVIEVGPGDLFAVPPGHDSEVIGDEPYVSLHLMGAGGYART
jgi:quercetin dioxygenase-like cupin family protein